MFQRAIVTIRDMIEQYTGEKNSSRRRLINSVLRGKPTKRFELALRRTVEWYLSNRGWWEPLLVQGGTKGIGLRPEVKNGTNAGDHASRAFPL